MPTTAMQVADRLQQQLDNERVNLITSHEAFGELARHVEDDAIDCDAPILAEYIAVDGDSTIKAMTNFSVTESDSLWALVENDVTIAWTLGRGRKPAVAAKDAFFITLSILKHFDTWFKHSLDFNIGMSTLEKMVHRVIQLVEPVLFAQFVKPVAMADQRADGHVFTNYPHALYATDVKFQPAYRPSGRFIEQKVYYSAKQSSTGSRLSARSRHQESWRTFPCTFLDRPRISRSCSTEPRCIARRCASTEATLSSSAASRPRSPTCGAMLVDKGYQGAGRVLRTIQPKKKARGGTLDRDNLARNKVISSDRVPVENFFGRMRSLWNTTYATFKWNENRFDTVTRLCVALTNFHASLMPLRAQDSDHCGMVLAKYQSMGDRIRTQRAAAQREYRACQQTRAHPTPHGSRRRSTDSETQFSYGDEESLAY